MIKHYFCYSQPLAHYLYQKGHRVITRAINPDSNSLFWLYILTPELSANLTAWTKNRPE